MGRLYNRVEPKDIPLPTRHPERTFAEAREALAVDLAAGKIVSCGCCGQAVKIYSRALSRKVAEALLALYRRGPLKPTEIVDVAQTRDYPNAAYYDLAEVIPDGELAGRWQLTDKGRAFIEARGAHANIFARVLVMNGHVIKYPQNAPLRQVPILFVNHEGKRFENVAPQAGAYCSSPHLGTTPGKVELRPDAARIPEVVRVIVVVLQAQRNRARLV